MPVGRNTRKVKIKHYPRDKHGNPLAEKNFIEFTTTEDNITPLISDEHGRPFKVFDGSVCYPCFKEEIEWL